ncbi:MAG: T9SS type A sorting domain-containing protein [Bacteroidia bacterium]|nr:T9SS type A sorting domain-containing protein [Bacteroidia bacterium]
MIKKILIIVFAAFLFAQNGNAQHETLTDLHANPVVVKKWQQVKTSYSKAKLSAQNPDTLALPFKDDFSLETVYPDSTKWIGTSVFINRTYPKAPPSIGVATFDGIDSTGYPYNFTAPPTSSGEADHLTSKPINLAADTMGNGYFPVDSIFLSFFYQAMGRGNSPESKDSLVLEFKRASTGTWDWIWSHKGYVPANNDTNFHAVIFPIVDTAYLKNGFQFRFKNYATLSGNADHWHIDYVYLNKSRNKSDTIFEDLAFVYNPSSLLKNYQAMPWEQFTAADLTDTLKTYIRNNYKVTKNTFYNYEIKDATGTQLSTYNGSSYNVDPYTTIGYLNYPPFTKPPLTYTIPPLTDSTLFIWESYIKAIPDFENNNDTVRFYQKFYNYYAYDDGTAEAGYFLSGTNPQLAIRFNLNVADTLKAIQLYFDPIITDARLTPFRLAVWNNNGGSPGSIIYKDSVVYPFYDSGYNAFHPYKISNPKLLLSAGTYYIGWLQSTSDPLNVGFDLNTNAQANTYINVSGAWQTSSFKGSVLLRPVFGKAIPFVGVEQLNASQFNIDVYPNPAQQFITVKTSDNSNHSVLNATIVDVYGQTVWSTTNFSTPRIDVSNFEQGLYFLKLTDNYLNTSVKRILVVH